MNFFDPPVQLGITIGEHLDMPMLSFVPRNHRQHSYKPKPKRKRVFKGSKAAKRASRKRPNPRSTT